MDLAEEKSLMRRVASDACTEEPNPDDASAAICARILSLPEYRDAMTVMCYLHCRFEVRTGAVVDDCLQSGKRLFVPYCTRDGFGHPMLGLWRLQSVEELVPGTWNILEPPPERWHEPGREAAPDDLDLILVPGVAFDRQGGRLGHGMGYYDRLLARARPDAVRVGVCYESQLQERVPMGPLDVSMNKVLTEKAVYLSATP